jgi:AhpD family alkylhydroperoxidase
MSTEIVSAFEAEQMNIAVEAPELSRALVALERELRIDPVLRELAKLRASILNGCAYCIDPHTKDARKADESEQRLYAVAAWHEAPFFNQRERAALALTDAVTLIADTHLPAATYDQAARHFDAQELAHLYLADRRDQRLEPDRRRDPQDRRRLPALSRLEPRAQCVRRRPVGSCLCAGG